MTGAPLLELADVHRHFAVRGPFGLRRGQLRAVDGVTLDVRPGEILGLVGESGCGKSTLGKTIMGIHAPTAGEIRFQGHVVSHLAGPARRAVCRELQYVYQDAASSLDPRWKIRRALDEPLIVHTDQSPQERIRTIAEILAAVGLPPGHLDLYPPELSGGQQRRIGLARILTLRPRLVILDEPTSGLDVSVQATVLKLLRELRATFNLTYLFISHDLGVVRMMCDRVAVMYLGRIVELGHTAEIFERPRHPYTQSLLAAIPRIGGERLSPAFRLEGDPTDPVNLPTGCRFRPRCPIAEARCAAEDPALRNLGAGAAACHLASA